MRSSIVRWLAVLVLAACGAPPAPAPPAPVAPVVFSSPGALIASHGTLVCNDCHVDNTPRVGIAKCMQCHAMNARTGLHAASTVRGAACTDCHGDHRGASFDARGWDQVGGKHHFDHTRLTGFALGAGHRPLACEACHTQKTPTGRPTFVGVANACASCHPSSHAGTPYAKATCETCHSTDSFEGAPLFDHDEKAAMIGSAHKRVACVQCHVPAFGTKGPPTACESCHAGRNPHGARFAAFGCATCHAPLGNYNPSLPKGRSSWRPRFDHAKQATWQPQRFHEALTCRSCHRGANPQTFERVAPGAQCMGCHEHARVHDTKYTNAQCLQCHVAAG